MPESAQHKVERWLLEHSEPLPLAELLCDRHDPGAAALTVADGGLDSREYTFGELRERSEQLAAILRAAGVERGDRVAVLLPKRVEHAVAFLAVTRLGALHVPLFTAFAAPTVSHRLADCGARLVVTDTANRAKVEWDGTVISVDEPLPPEDGDAGAPAVYGPDDPFILLYTSGTTGYPAGVEVPARALAAFRAYLEFGLDLDEQDVLWNAADPGWAYGLYYGLVAPLAAGRPILWIDAPFSPELAWGALDRFRVTNFAAGPTVYRALRAHGDGRRHELRAASSAGEPLNPEVIEWSRAALGTPVLDQYGQTELGMVICNHHDPELARDLEPGTMGVPMPGFSACVLDSGVDVEAPAGETGRLVIDVPGSPLFWFRGYWEQPERSAARFPAGGRFYLTGDAARRDPAGTFTFSGRTDDVILTSGYRIGPFEVENALCTHESVAEAAVVGKPDELRGEAIHAYVVLRPGFEASDELAATLQDAVRNRLARHAYPREVHFLDVLPKTPSGKVQRYLLRTQS